MREITFLFGLALGITAQVLLQPLLFSQEQAKSANQELWFNRAWAEKAFVDVPTPMAPRSRLVLAHEDRPGETKKNLSSGESRIRPGEEIYTGGLGLGLRSVLRVELTKRLSVNNNRLAPTNHRRSQGQQRDVAFFGLFKTH